jgi:replicative DNA helicase
MMGKNIVLASLEMSEDAFSQRFDSIFSLLDINRIYREKSMKLKLIKKLGELKAQEGRGNLYIKQYPTGKATVDDYRRYIRELRIRGIVIHEFVCDYLNLMKSQYKTKGDMYSDVKNISEELRAMSYEFKIPVVSVSQLNREGMNITFDEVDFTYISECLSLDTDVLMWDGKTYKNEKICNLRKGDIIKGSDDNVSVSRIFNKKIKKMYKIKTKSGKEIICSADHKFPTSDGFKNIKTGLKVGDFLSSL